MYLQTNYENEYLKSENLKIEGSPFCLLFYTSDSRLGTHDV